MDITLTSLIRYNINIITEFVLFKNKAFCPIISHSFAVVRRKLEVKEKNSNKTDALSISIEQM